MVRADNICHCITYFHILHQVVKLSFGISLVRVCGMYGPKGGNRGSGPHLKNHKNIGFPSIIGPDPLKSQSYQATIQCWAIISRQAKCHLNGVSQAGQ